MGHCSSPSCLTKTAWLAYLGTDINNLMNDDSSSSDHYNRRGLCSGADQDIAFIHCGVIRSIRDIISMVPQRRYGDHSSRLPTNTPILGLGCSSFSTFFSSDVDGVSLTVDTISPELPIVCEWVDTIRHAVLKRGINLLDTAPWYGHGVSEIIVGYALDTILENDCDPVVDSALPKHQQRIRTGSLPRCHLIVYTKVGRYEYEPLRQFDFSYDTTINSVQRSLERMNCSYIDVIQLHDPEFAPSISLLKKETIPALLECRKRGWAKAIGLTGYPLDVQHEILVDCHEEFDGEMIFDQSLVYCHNNLHDMSLYRDACFPPINDQVQRDGTDDSRKNNNNLISFTQFCQQSNIHLMAAAPLSMGLLTIAGPPKWHPASDSLKKACSIAAIVCQSKGIDISTLAVLYSLSQREIGCTLLGMKNVREVDIAADLAMRFCDIDFDQSHSIILDQILLPVEKEALELILDPTHGPFASVAANGKYRWDGQEEAKKFWERLATSNLE